MLHLFKAPDGIFTSLRSPRTDVGAVREEVCCGAPCRQLDFSTVGWAAQGHRGQRGCELLLPRNSSGKLLCPNATDEFQVVTLDSVHFYGWQRDSYSQGNQTQKTKTTVDN